MCFAFIFSKRNFLKKSVAEISDMISDIQDKELTDLLTDIEGDDLFLSEYNEQLAPEKADSQVMGMTIPWNSREESEKVDFPDIDWGIEFDEERSYKVFSGDWEWEVGQYRDMADETEYIRDYSLMTIFGNWSFLKNRYSKKEIYAKRRMH